MGPPTWSEVASDRLGGWPLALVPRRIWPKSVGWSSYLPAMRRQVFDPAGWVTGQSLDGISFLGSAGGRGMSVTSVRIEAQLAAVTDAPMTPASSYAASSP